MQNEPRRHHYISQFYLRGFAKSCFSKNSMITVLNLKKKIKFSATANSIAFERDFNRIETENNDPNLVEKLFSQLEYIVASKMRKVDVSNQFGDDEKIDILYYVAILAVRNPVIRQSIIGPILHAAYKFSFSSLLFDKHFREQTISIIKDKYPDITELDNEDIVHLVFKDIVSIEIGNAAYLHGESNMINPVYEHLLKRKWRLVRANDDTGPIITSDRPVSLISDNPSRLYSPGFALPNTTVYFPISQHQVLIGRFDSREEYVVANKELIAYINSATISCCHQQIFTPSINFNFIKNGIVTPGHDLLR